MFGVEFILIICFELFGKILFIIYLFNRKGDVFLLIFFWILYEIWNVRLFIYFLVFCIKGLFDNFYNLFIEYRGK